MHTVITRVGTAAAGAGIILVALAAPASAHPTCKAHQHGKGQFGSRVVVLSQGYGQAVVQTQIKTWFGVIRFPPRRIDC